MKRMHAAGLAIALALSACVGAREDETASAALASRVRAPSADELAAERALVYMDARAATWATSTWSFVNTADKTCTLSCHTTLPYVLARSAAPAASVTSFQLVVNKVKDRVSTWDTLVPYYDWAKAESRATESIVSSVALAAAARNGSATSAAVASARDHAWALQTTAGDFNWLQEDLAPFEDTNARYWGTALFALGLGLDATPPSGTRFDRLQSFLRTQFDTQNLHARTMATWASLRISGLLPADKVARVITELRDAQHCDGGWSLASFGNWRTKAGVLNVGTTAPSDGYGTALATLVLAESGTSQTRVALARAWLVAHQLANGAWPMTSMNRPETAFNNTVMTDAGAAYGILALRAEAAPGRSTPPPGWVYVAAAPPTTYDRAQAAAACTTRGARLPQVAELKKLVEAELLRCTLKTGWTWTSDAPTPAGSGTLFSFDEMSAGRPPEGGAPLARTTDHVVCIK